MLAFVWVWGWLVCWCLTDASIFITGSDSEYKLKLAQQHRAESNVQMAADLYGEIISRGDEYSRDGMVLLADLLEMTDTASSQYSSLYLLVKAASLGHADAQHKIGAMYASGLYEGIAPLDAGRSLLLQYISALSGSPEANIAIGYRFAHGIGIAESCEGARLHYEFSANIAAKKIQDRGYSLFIDRSKLGEEEQRSVLSYRKKSQVDEEMIDYYKRLALEGDSNAAMKLAEIFITGSRVLEQDYDRAVHYLQLASKGGSIAATGLLGYLMAQGFGASIRNSMTDSDLYNLLVLSAKTRDVNGVVGLGVAYRDGVGVSRNVTRALELFTSVMIKHADAGFYIGEILMGAGLPDVEVDISGAVHGYVSSSQRGHILAIHRLGHLYSEGIGVAKHCPSAVNSFKLVAEKGDWMVGLSDAHKLYVRGDIARALLLFSRYAVMGIDTAQFNVANILAKRYCPNWEFSIDDVDMFTNSTEENKNEADNKKDGNLVTIRTIHSKSNETVDRVRDFFYSDEQQVACETRALQFYGLSAGQHDAESVLRIGDMHYYGMAGLAVDKLEATRFYQIAADLRHSHANFNLGIMHEVGDGIQQDFHLAKRYYDQAAEYDPEARLPSSVALFLLNGHQKWQELMGVESSNQLLQQAYTMLASTNFQLGQIFNWLSKYDVCRRFLLKSHVRQPVSVGKTTSKKGGLSMSWPVWFTRTLLLGVEIISRKLWNSLNEMLQSFGVAFGIQPPDLDDLLKSWGITEALAVDLENYMIPALLLLLLILIEIFRNRRRRIH